MAKYFAIFKNGLWNENPIFKLIIGLCPTLAVTNTVVNGLAMGLATGFVLISSEIVISLIKRWIPNDVRIPSFILIIVTFVTFIDYFMGAFLPEIADALALFIPLIVVNCLILGRQEAFASRNPTRRAIFDAVGMTVGFTWVLVVLSAIRELFGFGTLAGVDFFGAGYTNMIIMIMPGGAFLTLGVLVGVLNLLDRKVGSDNG